MVHFRHALAAVAFGFIFTTIDAANAYAQHAVRVSTASDGTPGNAAAGPHAALDDSGRYVVFADASTNLVTGDGNGSVDVFVKDRVSNATTRVSVASDGSERSGDSGMAGLDVSGDGQIVAFASKAALVANDTNTCGDPVGACEDIYVHDRGTGTTTRVSVATGGGQANGMSDSPSISRNGRYVAFTSRATNLVASDTNAASDVFVHDRVTGTTTRLSVSTAGVQGGSGRYSGPARINEDGTIVAFMSQAKLSDEPDPVGCEHPCRLTYVHDRTAGTTVPVPVSFEELFFPYASQYILRATVSQVHLDTSGRWVGLMLAQSGCPSMALSMTYDRATGRSFVVDSVTRHSYGDSLTMALSGDGSTVASSIFFTAELKTVRCGSTV